MIVVIHVDMLWTVLIHCAVIMKDCTIQRLKFCCSGRYSTTVQARDQARIRNSAEEHYLETLTHVRDSRAQSLAFAC